MELPPNIFNDFDEATVEAWVRFDDLSGREKRVFNYGDARMDMSLMTGYYADNTALALGSWLRTCTLSGPTGSCAHSNGFTWRG